MFALRDVVDDRQQGWLAPERNSNQGNFRGEFRAVPALVDPIEMQRRARLHGRVDALDRHLARQLASGLAFRGKLHRAALEQFINPVKAEQGRRRLIAVDEAALG